ncbi:hypothetical protein, partial [Novosphingobium rosa]|uniref:hypothetical protein n=1 Tax=Novosphingobium rosa TaxID=76978 RepID=UPI001C3FC6F9
GAQLLRSDYPPAPLWAPRAFNHHPACGAAIQAPWPHPMRNADNEREREGDGPRILLFLLQN